MSRRAVYNISFDESLGRTLEDGVVDGNAQATLSNFKNTFLKLVDEIQLLENAIGNMNIDIYVDRDCDCIFLHGNSADILQLQQLPSISDNLDIDEEDEDDEYGEIVFSNNVIDENDEDEDEDEDDEDDEDDDEEYITDENLHIIYGNNYAIVEEEYGVEDIANSSDDSDEDT
jgi:hypothetical protein